jgi:hypothetical protein
MSESESDAEESHMPEDEDNMPPPKKHKKFSEVKEVICPSDIPTTHSFPLIQDVKGSSKIKASTMH